MFFVKRCIVEASRSVGSAMPIIFISFETFVYFARSLPVTKARK